MRLALYQPDIPQNAGNMLRLAACMNVPVDLIEPAGFVVTDRYFKRAAMDYLAHVELHRHASWEAFRAAGGRRGRLVLLTTRAACAYTDHAFAPDDTLLVGRESAGVPDAVHDAADAAVRIPMVRHLRSLNVATAAAMVLGEALRQTGAFPHQGPRARIHTDGSS